jgi:uncharacterized protein YkwD
MREATERTAGTPILPSLRARSFKTLGLLIAALVIVALLLVSVLASPAQAGVSYSSDEVAFVQLINDYRVGLGLSPLLVSDMLSESSDRHNSDMAKYGFFSHYTQASDWFAAGASPWDRMAASGYDYNTWMGENIAAGYSTAAAVFAAWKSSPDHNDNMVDPNFKVIGVSLVYESGATYHYYWTTDFGGYVDPTAHTLGSPASTTTTTASTTTTTTAYVSPTTTTTAYVPPTTTTTTVYVPPPTTTTTAYVPPTTTTTAYVPPPTTTTTAYVPPTATTTTGATTTTTLPATTFTDVSGGTLYASQIWLLASRGIVAGYGDGYFGPYEKVTRQQFAKMIVLTLGYTVWPVSACTFKDVAILPGSSDPLYPAGYIASCAAAGITVGKTVDKFGPYDQISRAQLITMVARAANLPDPPSTYQPPFGYFSAEHYPWARRAAYAGLLDGFVGMDSSFNFWASATRGEVCLLLADLLGD